MDNDDWNVLNPTVIVEVLPPGTNDYDRGGKFKLYRDIATLKELGNNKYRSFSHQRWRSLGVGRV